MNTIILGDNMKKIIVFLFIVAIVYINFSQKSEKIVIPTSSIRYRIIANSDSVEDQMLKIRIKDDINKEIMPILENADSLDESRELIVNNLSDIKKIVSKYTDDYNVDYGYNYFPNKTYKGVEYDSGKYESLVITLGDGLGENWWCVMYPPLCLIDGDDMSDIEYTTLISEMIDK